MGLTTVPRTLAKMEYLAIRLPFALLEQHVVARYLDDEARLRLGFERLLGSLDSVAGWLLADDAISRRGQVLRRRTEFLGKAADLEAKAEARRAQADDKLKAEQSAARETFQQAHRELNEKVGTAYRREQEERQHVRGAGDARAAAEKAQAQQTAQRRTAGAEAAKQAEPRRISAQEGRATAAAKPKLSDAADKRKSSKDRREDADRLRQLPGNQRDGRRQERDARRPGGGPPSTR